MRRISVVDGESHKLEVVGLNPTARIHYGKKAVECLSILARRGDESKLGDTLLQVRSDEDILWMSDNAT